MKIKPFDCFLGSCERCETACVTPEGAAEGTEDRRLRAATELDHILLEQRHELQQKSVHLRSHTYGILFILHVWQ